MHRLTRFLAAVILAGALAIAVSAQGKHDPSQEEMERALAVFTRVLKSESQAKIHLKFLFDYSHSSPYRFSTLTQATQVLAVGGESISDIDGAIGPCGDMAAALASDGKEQSIFGSILGGVFDVGNSKDEEVVYPLNALEQTGVPAYSILSEATGMSQPKLRALVDSGRLRAKIAKRVLLEGFAHRYGGLAAKLAADEK